MPRSTRAVPSNSQQYNQMLPDWNQAARLPQSVTMSSTPSTWATLSQIGSSAIRLEAARTYIRQTSRYRVFLTLPITLVAIGAEVWAIATYLNGGNPIAEGIYAVDEKQGWINLVAFVVGLLGFLAVAVLLTRAVMGIWAKWDRVVYENILQK